MQGDADVPTAFEECEGWGHKAAVTGNARVQAEKERISAALGEDGRILLRESGTEPVIRVMVEAQSDELCAKYVDEMVQVIREEGFAVE